ncbi:hypothetical protein [Neisseria sp. Ec49-e6-T10]|uniref:hypothetical protein n=1 Tax=Neisseria sp. Ec49-e6-T10 TaxID=3140744 RepID=UPI003EC06D5E
MNHLIHQSDDIRQSLQNYHGHFLMISLAGQNIQALIKEDGFLAKSSQEPEVVITLKQSALLKVAQKQIPGVADVHIQGNHHLGLALLPLLGALQYHPEDDLIRLFGDDLGAVIANRLFRCAKNFSELKQRVVEQITDYAYEEHAPFVHHKHLEQLTEHIETLRDDVARLQARVNKLNQDKA